MTKKRSGLEEQAQAFLDSEAYSGLTPKTQAFMEKLVSSMLKAAKKPSDELMESIEIGIEKFEDAYKKPRFGKMPAIRLAFDEFYQAWQETVEEEVDDETLAEERQALAEEFQALQKEFKQWWEQSNGKTKAAADGDDVKKVEVMLKNINAICAKIEAGENPVTRFSNPFYDVTMTLAELIEDATKANHRAYVKFLREWRTQVKEAGFDDRYSPV